jgi:hypothetical protein
MVAYIRRRVNSRLRHPSVNMGSIFLRIALTIAALVLSASAIVAHGGCRGSDFACFKRRMMPRVGRKVAVVGVLASAKLGWIVTTEGGGVYVYAVREADASKMKALEGLSGQRVKVTGTLRYSAGSTPARGEEAEAGVPGHFFFDVAEARVVGLSKPRPKRSKSGAARAP